MTSQVPFTPLTPEAVERLTLDEALAFEAAACAVAGDQKPSLEVVAALVLTVQRLIAGRPGTATGPAEGNWRERAERAEAQLAEVRQAIAAFFTHHGNSAAFALRSARDLAEGIRQVLDRAALEALEAGRREPLSAVCTGPDCGEQFTDSETSEYLFATRERMERLLYADGWASDPVLCPACQQEAKEQT